MSPTVDRLIQRAAAATIRESSAVSGIGKAVAVEVAHADDQRRGGRLLGRGGDEEPISTTPDGEGCQGPTIGLS